jgi:hypothetical protein
MKKLLVLALLPLLFSCSKKKGCNAKSAINYDPEAVIDDDSCIYSKLTFFADSTHINGNQIDHIDITINNQVIGTFSGMHAYGPGTCDADNTANYASIGESTVSWTSTIYMVSGSTFTRSGEVSTDASLSCIEVHASL